MRQMILLVLVIYAKEYYAQNGFVLDSIDMTDAVFEQCEYCDEQSNRRNQRTEEQRNHNELRNQSYQAVAAQEHIEAGSNAVADALRKYMTQNHINILLEQGKS